MQLLDFPARQAWENTLFCTNTQQMDLTLQKLRSEIRQPRQKQLRRRPTTDGRQNEGFMTEPPETNKVLFQRLYENQLAKDTTDASTGEEESLSFENAKTFKESPAAKAKVK